MAKDPSLPLDNHGSKVYIFIFPFLLFATLWRLRNVRPFSAILGRKKLEKLNPNSIFFGVVVGILLSQFFHLFASSSFSKSSSPSQSNSNSLHQSMNEMQNSKFYDEIKELPEGILMPTTDLFLRRLWGKPEEDLPRKAKYLLAMRVSFSHADAVDKVVSRFSFIDWSVMIFHDDFKVDDWLEYNWATHAIHVAAPGQSKWWFAKRFLHPDIVDSFDYILIWDQYLDPLTFNPSRYIEIMKQNKLEISQPAIEYESDKDMTWQITKRVTGSIIHKKSKEKGGWCKDDDKPPCGGFVEIQFPAFSRKAWICVWHLIQNDLIHGWGLDFQLHKCAQGLPHEKIGVVDAEFIKYVPLKNNLKNVEDPVSTEELLNQIQARGKYEWDLFKFRFNNAEEKLKRLQPDKKPRIIIN